jgi:hypothetical protein
MKQAVPVVAAAIVAMSLQRWIAVGATLRHCVVSISKRLRKPAVSSAAVG